MGISLVYLLGYCFIITAAVTEQTQYCQEQGFLSSHQRNKYRMDTEDKTTEGTQLQESEQMEVSPPEGSQQQTTKEFVKDEETSMEATPSEDPTKDEVTPMDTEIESASINANTEQQSITESKTGEDTEANIKTDKTAPIDTTSESPANTAPSGDQESAITQSTGQKERNDSLETENKEENGTKATLSDSSVDKTETSVDIGDSVTQPAAGEEEVRSKESKGKKKEEDDDDDAPFPTTLEGFGYHFKDRRLCNIETDEGFVFEAKKGHKRYNQCHYEAIGEVITEEVYKLLESEAGLEKVNIPNSAKKDCSFFFTTPGALKADKLMVLIHGSGVVRAGQWARSLIINHSLDSGTQLPYIHKAKQEGYGVIVTNTNENIRLVKGKMKSLKESETPEAHAYYIWQHFIKKSKAQHIDIVAHSYGGVVTVSLMNQFFNDFKKRVKKIAFTDSVHAYNPARVPPAKWTWLSAVSTNWVMSDEPIDTELDAWDDNVRRLSAGTPKHVETSWKAFESVFEYFNNDQQ